MFTGYLLHSGNPYILWSAPSAFAKHFTIDCSRLESRTPPTKSSSHAVTGEKSTSHQANSMPSQMWSLRQKPSILGNRVACTRRTAPTKHLTTFGSLPFHAIEIGTISP